MKVSQAFIERGIREIQRALKDKGSKPMLPEIFYVWTDIDAVAAEAKCKAMNPARYPCFVRFVGPNGGPELGTGPLQDQTDICDEENLEDGDES